MKIKSNYADAPVHLLQLRSRTVAPEITASSPGAAAQTTGAPLRPPSCSENSSVEPFRKYVPLCSSTVTLGRVVALRIPSTFSIKMTN